MTLRRLSRRGALTLLSVFAAQSQAASQALATGQGRRGSTAPPTLVLVLSERAQPSSRTAIGAIDVMFDGQVVHVTARELFDALKVGR